MRLPRRLAILAVLATILGRRVGSAAPAWLTIDLNRWDGLTVVYRGQTVHLRAVDVFEMLKEM